MRGKPSKLYSESLNDLIVTGIVERYKFKNPGRYNYEKLDAYLVDSEVSGFITYGIDKERVFIIERNGFMVCSIKDIDKLLKSLKKAFKHELEDILLDAKDLRRMNVDYEKPVSPSLSRTVRNLPRNLQET